jgi:CRP-like cAMP-binding protein
MKEILLKYMAQFTSLNEEEQRAVSESVRIEEYKKGSCLLRQGDLPDIKCYFVLKGCVR